MRSGHCKFGHTASSTETNLTPSATRAGGGLGHKAGYQPHIDGLRAIAVLSVVFYHLGLGPFPGGFVGVDVFFVISGFLISRIIYAETRRGDFSLSRFYVRRVRRIAPACSSSLHVGCLCLAVPPGACGLRPLADDAIPLRSSLASS